MSPADRRAGAWHQGHLQSRKAWTGGGGGGSHQAFSAALLMTRCLVRVFSPLPAILRAVQGGDGWLEACSEERGG